MRTNLAAIRASLDTIEARVRDGNVEPSMLWRGAKVVITAQPSPPPKSAPFMAPDFEVATPHAEALSWLFFQLRDAFEPDADSKYDFFGRLAEVAAEHAAERTAPPLLMAVLAEARAIYAELVKRERPSSQRASNLTLVVNDPGSVSAGDEDPDSH